MRDRNDRRHDDHHRRIGVGTLDNDRARAELQAMDFLTQPIPVPAHARARPAEPETREADRDEPIRDEAPASGGELDPWQPPEDGYDWAHDERAETRPGPKRRAGAAW